MRLTDSSLLLAVAAAVACGGGNISPDNFAPPTVRVHHIAVKNAGLSGGSMNVVMAFYNPNRGQIRGSRIQGAFDIDNTHVGDVSWAETFTLKGHDTTLVTVPMQFKWSGASSVAKSVLGYGTVNYHMTGVVGVNTQDGHPFDVPFNGEGSASVLHP